MRSRPMANPSTPSRPGPERRSTPSPCRGGSRRARPVVPGAPHPRAAPGAARHRSWPHPQGRTAGHARGLAVPGAGAGLSPARAADDDGDGIQASACCAGPKWFPAGWPTQYYAVSRSLREAALAEGLCAPDKIKVLVEGHLDGVDAERFFNPARWTRRHAARCGERIGHPSGGPRGRLRRAAGARQGVGELAQAWGSSGRIPGTASAGRRPDRTARPIAAVGPGVLRRGDARPCDGRDTRSGHAAHYRGDGHPRPADYREGFNTVLFEAGRWNCRWSPRGFPAAWTAYKTAKRGRWCLSATPRRWPRRSAFTCGTPNCAGGTGAAAGALVLRSFQPPALGAALYREYLRLLDPVEPGLPRSEIADSTGSRVRQNAGNVRQAGSRVRQNAGDADPRSGERGYLRGDAEPRSGERGYLRDKRSRVRFYRRRGKRLLDLALSGAALMLLTPVLAVLAILVRRFLGPPVLFRQRRHRPGRRPFTIVKFRTMTEARDASGELLPDSSRLTRFGDFCGRPASTSYRNFERAEGGHEPRRSPAAAPRYGAVLLRDRAGGGSSVAGHHRLGAKSTAATTWPGTTASPVMSGMPERVRSVWT